MLSWRNEERPINYARRTASRGSSPSGEDGNRRGQGRLQTKRTGCRVSKRMDQGQAWLATIPLAWSAQGWSGNDLGVSDLQRSTMDTPALEPSIKQRAADPGTRKNRGTDSNVR